MGEAAIKRTGARGQRGGTRKVAQRKTDRRTADSGDRGSPGVTNRRKGPSRGGKPASSALSVGQGRHDEEPPLPSAEGERTKKRGTRSQPQPTVGETQGKARAKTATRKRSAEGRAKQAKGTVARKTSSSRKRASPPAAKQRGGRKSGSGRPKKAAGRAKPDRLGRGSRAGASSAGRPFVFEALALKRPVYGLGTFIAVAEALGTTHDVQIARTEAFGASPGPGAAARKFNSKARLEELARVLAAFGSPHRLRILTTLLYGSATYRTLQRASKLKAGPFYHHVNQLRLSGFLGPKTRDLYVLTRAGRNALLVALSLAPLMKDHRIRPMPEVDKEEE